MIFIIESGVWDAKADGSCNIVSRKRYVEGMVWLDMEEYHAYVLFPS